MIYNIQDRPGAALVFTNNEYEEPEGGEDKAEYGHKHDPAKRIR